MTDKKLSLKILNEEIAEVKKELNDVITVLNAMAETIATPIKEDKLEFDGTDLVYGDPEDESSITGGTDLVINPQELNSAEVNR